ncbi:hypothetical protein GF325_02255 [Candidatus Bathyarchaeota archaeon]|nr:hypothetical protein [Candidatus Bathyarchaeota archaeon]
MMPDGHYLQFHLNVGKRDTTIPLQYRKAKNAEETRRVVKRGEKFSEVESQTIAVYTIDNPIINKLENGEDVLQELIDSDQEMDIELTGRYISYKNRILLNEENEFVTKYNEFKVIENKEGEVVAEREILERPVGNINKKEEPVRILKRMKKIDAFKKFAFKASYYLVHDDGLSYDFLREIAENLANGDEMALIGVLQKQTVDGKEKHIPKRLRLKTGAREYWGWLEGRVKDEEYALILHLTAMELS